MASSGQPMQRRDSVKFDHLTVAAPENSFPCSRIADFTTLRVHRMNVRPLIVRELRAEARRSNTYWLRTLAAGLLTALFVWSVWNFQGGPQLGPLLFNSLSQGLQLAMVII